MSAGRRVSQFQLVTGSGQINIFDDRIPILLMNQVGQQRSATVSPSILAQALNINTGSINLENIVFTSGDQNISGDKNFYSRITINGTGVLLSGEVPDHNTGYLSLYLLKSETGNFYDNSNPSGFITGVDLSNYVIISQLTGVSGFLQEQISDINQLTGDFYLNSNPSGFITGIDLSNYSTINYVTGVSGALQVQITNLSNETGNYVLDSETGQFYPNSNPSDFISTEDADLRFINATGNENVSGVKNFFSRPTVNSSGVLLSGELANFDTGILSGYVNKSETGQFYAASNPSGFITGLDLSDYSTITYVTGVSGTLQSQVSDLNNKTGEYALSANTGNFITNSQTGQFYPTSNPSGFITGVNLDNYTTIEYVTGISGTLNQRIENLEFNSGDWNEAAAKQITGINVSGSTTKTINILLNDGTDLSASFTDLQGSGSSSGSASLDVQIFTTSDNWIKPVGAKRVWARIVAPGGGGGSGRRGAAGTVRGGGGGGAAGGHIIVELDPATLSDTEAVIIGAVGIGGAPATTDDTNGSVGTAGGTTEFAGWQVFGGNGGGLGSTSLGTAGTARATQVGFVGQVLVSSAAGGAGGGGNAPNLASINGSTGGGGGGRIQNTNTTQSGGDGGGQTWTIRANVNGGLGSTAGNNGNVGNSTSLYTGTGGGGGGTGDAGGTVPGGRGGDGGGYGAGGGGGGGSTNGADSGAGGDGSPGIIIITTEL